MEKIQPTTKGALLVVGFDPEPLARMQSTQPLLQLFQHIRRHEGKPVSGSPYKAERGE